MVSAMAMATAIAPAEAMKMNSDATVLGIDPGKTATGIALLDYESGEVVLAHVIEPTALDHSASHNASLAHIYRVIGLLYRTKEPIDVWIEEGLVLGSRKGTRTLAEVAGVINAATCFTCQTLNVTEIKRHATGKGNATKAEMADAAATRWGPSAFNHIEPKLREHAIDAAWIASLGLSISHQHFRKETNV